MQSKMELLRNTNYPDYIAMKKKIIVFMKALKFIADIPVSESRKKAVALDRFFNRWAQMNIPEGEPGYRYVKGAVNIEGCGDPRYVRHLTYTNSIEEFSVEIKVITEGGLPPSITAHFFDLTAASISIG